MSVTLDLDTSKFVSQMNRFVTELGMDSETVLRTQSRLLGERLIAFTPPKTLKMGRNAVEVDMYKVTGFPSVDAIRDDKLRTKMRQIIQRRDYDGLQAIAQHMYPRERYLVEPFTPALHRAARDPRLHRVWNKVNRLSLNQPDFKRYLAEVKKHVGRLRAGWIPFLTFGRGTAVKWVQRHIHHALAPHVVMTQNVKSIAVTNRGVGILRLAERFRDAVRTRERDMIKSIKAQLRLKKQQLQLT